MFKKSIWGLFLLLIMAALMAACSSDNEADANEKSDGNAKEYAAIFEETDAIAHDFMVVKVEQNYPEILKYLSTDGIEELKEDREYLLERHRLPGEFEKHDEMYELRRYDNFYDEKNEEIYYRYQTPDDKGVLINSWIIMKKNDNNEWKIKSYFGERPELINDSTAETGTVLHELPKDK